MMTTITGLTACSRRALLGLALLAAANAGAAQFYVAPTGNDGGPGSEAKPWATLGKANKTLDPGDTVYVGPGTYRERIEPRYSGRDGAYITYERYTADDPVITAPPGRVALVLKGKDYIAVRGFSFDGLKPYTQSNTDSWAQLDNANYNIIENSSFANAKGWSGISLQDSDYNRFLNNDLDLVGTLFEPKTQEGMGNMWSITCSDYNFWAGNHMTRAGHTLMAINGSFNWITGNVFDNQWGKDSGYKNIELMHRNSVCKTAADHNVFERNVVMNALPRSVGFRGNTKPEPSPGMILDGNGQIVRFNLFVNNSEAAIHSAYRPPILSGIQGVRVYNNTFYDNGGLWQVWDYGNAGAIADNEFKNNIIAASTGKQIVARLTAPGRSALEDTRFVANAFSGAADFDLGAGARGKQTLKQMLTTKNFTDSIEAAPDFTSTALKDPQAFLLRANSQMIDAGIALTRTTGAGDHSDTVHVIDAGYFSDAGDGTMTGVDGKPLADVIQVGVSQRLVVIKHVDTATDTLTLARRLKGWDAGAKISLPYQGPAPDIGAREYDPAPPPNRTGGIAADFSGGAPVPPGTPAR